MSQPSPAQCVYTYDPPDNITPDPRVDVPRPSLTQCPHDVVDDEGRRCLFHHGETDYPSDQFTEQFLQTLADGERPPVFTGGRLPGLKLRGQTISTPGGAPIDLRGAIIDGELDLTNATVEVPLLLDDAAIRGPLRADGATFEAPVSLAGADIGGSFEAHKAVVSGGLIANDLSAGYVDWRGATVEGPLILEGASFSANVLLARATVEGDFILDDASFKWSLDSTAATITRDMSGTAMTVNADCDFVAAQIGGSVELRKAAVSGDADWSHARVGGDLRAPDCSFSGDAIFDDVAVGGEGLVFDGSTFTAKADFATMDLSSSRISFANAQFDDEVWFTHSTIGEVATFDGATFDGMSHLRDAEFNDDLILRNTRGTDQFFLAGSTVDGECDCTNANFDHFQFSATVQGQSDFSHARFNERAIFSSSTFGDRVWFDDASFAGHADFSDARFTGKTSFEGTEFLVDPTFEDTRFAVEPDLSVADFSLADSIDFDDRRSQMILAHPDTLQHEGVTMSLERATEEISLADDVRHLAPDNLSNTRLIVDALSDFDQRSWYEFSQQSLRTARTAVAHLPESGTTVLVFGLTIDEGAHGSEFLADMCVAAVYCRTGSEVRFGHLNTELSDVNYLMPVLASDDAFESGGAVATPSELHTAALRTEAFRAAMLRKQEGDGQTVNQLTLPVILGVGEVS